MTAPTVCASCGGTSGVAIRRRADGRLLCVACILTPTPVPANRDRTDEQRQRIAALADDGLPELLRTNREVRRR